MKINYKGLPSQMVNTVRKRNDKLAKETMDALESLAVNQIRENRRFEDYYKMCEGTLVGSDYAKEDLSVLNDISSEFLKDEMPNYLRHYDIIGIIVNQLVGEWISSKDDFIIDCVDNYTENEFLRERTRKLHEYMAQQFQLEVMKSAMAMGMDLNQEFESPEEQQAFQQQIQELANSIKSPEQIEDDMKTWKTQAIGWANSVIEQDYYRFRMSEIDKTEMKDFCLTGRFFRNYRIGYDFYTPENWSPMQVFFSQDEDIRYPQKGEYVGRQQMVPIYKIKEKYGHKLSSKTLKELDQVFYNTRGGGTSPNLNTVEGLTKALFPGNEILPFYNYRDHEAAKDFQDLFDVPMGIDVKNIGEEDEIRTPYYLSNQRGGRYNYLDRSDITVRKDCLLVTEVYYRSYKKMWFICYTDKTGVDTVEIVTNEILPEFIEENNLKKVETKSLYEIKDTMTPGEMYSYYQPEVRLGIKISTGLGEPIYEDDVLDYQIKGDSEYFDVLLPVGGIISGNFIANKLRPYQVAYNICLNQAMNMMEKELGLFYIFDVNLLSSEYKDMGDTEEALLRLADFAKNTGLAPADMSKQNTANNSPQGNAFVPIDMSYGNHISGKMQHAENYKRMGLEQIGITTQRLGTPTAYETAEGVRQGVDASYAQTEDITSTVGDAKLRCMEIHLAVAQYCQKEHIDADLVFSKDDGSKSYLNLNDPEFPLRRIGVLPMNDSRRRKQRDTFIQTVMSMNTFGTDVHEYAELFDSKSMQQIRERTKKAQDKMFAREREKMAQEKEIADNKIAADQKIAQDNIDRLDNKERLDREKDIIVAQIGAMGKAADKDSSTADMNLIINEAKLAIQQTESEHRINSDKQNYNHKVETESKRAENEARKLDLEERNLSFKERQIDTELAIALVNKN